MAYNPYNYQFQNQMQNFSMNQPVMQQPQAGYVFSWVQGDAGAKAMMTQPGVTAVMLDTENPVLYMKYTDPTGRPQEMQKRYLVTEEEYKKLQTPAPDYVTRKEFEDFVKRFDSEEENEPTV